MHTVQAADAHAARTNDDRIGVVGAKLYYPTETIQHAGIVLGLGGAAGHIQVGFPRGDFGYFGRLIESVN